MKAQKTKKQKNISQKVSVSQKKDVMQKQKINLSGFLKQETSQLENYKAFFQYLLSNDNELPDES